MRSFRRAVVVAAVLACLAVLHSPLGGCASPPRPDVERIGLSSLVDARDFPDANAVILLDRTEVSFLARPGARPLAEVQHTYRFAILREPGRELARVLVPFDERTRVMAIRSRLIKRDGREFETPAAAILDVDRFKDGTPAAALYDGPGFKLTRVGEAEVGDIVEVVTLLRVRDPRWLEPVSVGGALPFQRGEIVLNVPRDLDVDVRVTKQGRVVDMRPTRIPTTVRMLSEPTLEPQAGTRFAYVFDREPAIYPEGGNAAPSSLATQLHAVVRQPGSTDGFRSVDDVAAWYREIIGPRDRPDADVKRAVQGIRGGKTEKVKQVQRWLQDDVGDVPTFLNLAALPARTPAQVLAAKVGDAKDQATLGLAMLRALGVDAFPVLVSRQGSYASIPDLATPAPFNHVVLAVPQGGSYAWIDPSSRGLPTGRLAGALQGGKGVLVRPDGGELIDLPEDAAEQNTIDVTLALTLGADGRMDGVARATLTGIDAGRAREILAGDEDGAAAMMQDLLLGAVDGDASRVIRLPFLDVFRVASRTVEAADDSVRVQARLQPAKLDQPLQIVVDELAGRPLGFLWREGRRSPLYVDHRLRWTVRVEVKLPEGTGINALPASVDKPGPAVSLDEKWAIADGTLLFQRALTLHERSLPPARVSTLRDAVVASWQRAQEPVHIVAGGDRGAQYGADPF